MFMCAYGLVQVCYNYWSLLWSVLQCLTECCSRVSTRLKGK